VSSNATKAKNEFLWEFVLNEASYPDKPQTAAQKAQIAQLRAVVDRTFAPKNCNDLGH
jgi:hypothetical protein